MQAQLNYACLERMFRLRADVRRLVSHKRSKLRPHFPGGTNPQAAILERAYLLQLRLDLETRAEAQIQTPT